jgi:hypothetical protein
VASEAQEVSRSLLLGLAAGPAWSAEAGADPVPVSRAVASVSYGYRRGLDPEGFLAVASRAEAALESDGTIEDREVLGLDARLRRGPGFLDGGFDARASALEDSPYFAVDGRLGYRSAGQPVEAGAWLVGLLDARPQDDEDRVGGGLRAALLVQPSVRFSLETSAGLVAESWFDADLLTPSGSPSGDTRADVVADLRFSAGGLAGYFTEWSLSLYGIGRLSNADRLVAPGMVDSDSESRVGAGIEGSLSWSPTRRFGLELRGRAEPSWYRGRAALTAAGAPSGESLITLYGAASLRADWAIGPRASLILEAAAETTTANDPAEESWSSWARAGIEISL